MTQKQTPSERQLARLAYEAMKHASEGMTEAEGMLTRERWHWAFSTATLAIEEIGKAALCLAALGMPEDVRALMPFGAAFTDHKTKIAGARLILTIFGSNSPPPAFETITENIEASARATHQMRLHGMYVNYDDNGDLRLPSEVGEEAARGIVGELSAMLEMIPPSFRLGPLDDEELADFFRVFLAEVLGAEELFLATNSEMVSFMQNEFLEIFGVKQSLADIEANPESFIERMTRAVEVVRTQSEPGQIPSTG